MKRTKPGHWKRSLLFAIGLYLMVGGCCDGMNLKLPRMDGFLDGVFDLDASFHWDLAVDVDLEFSFDLWCGISGFHAASLGLQIDADATFRLATLLFDVDNDGYDEEIEALIITNPQSTSQPIVIFKWTGDKYTLDGSMQYLAWVDGTSVTMVTAEVGSSGGVMVCDKGATSDAETVCRACNEDYTCEVCDADGSQESCVAAAGDVVTADTGVDSDTGTDSDTDSDTGADSDTDVGTDSGTDTDSGVTVDVTIDIGIGF